MEAELLWGVVTSERALLGGICPRHSLSGQLHMSMSAPLLHLPMTLQLSDPPSLFLPLSPSLPLSLSLSLPPSLSLTSFLPPPSLPSSLFPLPSSFPPSLPPLYLTRLPFSFINKEVAKATCLCLLEEASHMLMVRLIY